MLPAGMPEELSTLAGAAQEALIRSHAPLPGEGITEAKPTSQLEIRQAGEIESLKRKLAEAERALDMLSRGVTVQRISFWMNIIRYISHK